MLAALAAEFTELETASGRLLILSGGVVLVFAISTQQLYNLAGHLVELLLYLLSFRRALSGSEPGNRRLLFEVLLGLKAPFCVGRIGTAKAVP
jgi:hypothetical protein